MQLSPHPVKSMLKAAFMSVNHKAVYSCLHAFLSLSCAFSLTLSHTHTLLQQYIYTGPLHSFPACVAWNPCNATTFIPWTIHSSSRMQTHSHSIGHLLIHSVITTGTCYHATTLTQQTFCFMTKRCHSNHAMSVACYQCHQKKTSKKDTLYIRITGSKKDTHHI